MVFQDNTGVLRCLSLIVTCYLTIKLAKFTVSVAKISSKSTFQISYSSYDLITQKHVQGTQKLEKSSQQATQTPKSAKKPKTTQKPQIKRTPQTTQKPQKQHDLQPRSNLFSKNFLLGNFTTQFPFPVPEKMRTDFTTAILNCASGEIDCTNYQIAESKLAKIPLDIYKNVVLDGNLHTDFNKTKVYVNTTICAPGTGVNVVITPRDRNGNFKRYYGDKFIARLVWKRNEHYVPNFADLKKLNQSNYEHVVVPIEVKNDDEFEEYARYSGEVACVKPGVYHLQVIFLRSAEHQETMRRITNNNHMLNLGYQCALVEKILPTKNKLLSAECGAGLPFILSNLNTSICAVDNRLGDEWYVKMGLDMLRKSRREENYLIKSTSQEIPLCEHDLVIVFRRQSKNWSALVRNKLQGNIIFENEGYEQGWHGEVEICAVSYLKNYRISLLKYRIQL